MTIDAVARTAWLTARLRAAEAKRPAPLFDDPFAARLVAVHDRPDDERVDLAPIPIVDALAAWMMLSRTDPPAASAVARAAALAVRTRYFDDALLAAVAAGAQTVVLLAAGLDARAYRLSLPSDLRWIEVDRSDVLVHKRDVLADVSPRAELIDVAGDARDASVLDTVRRSVRGPSVWLLEGLLMYLEPSDAEVLLDRVAAQLLPGSSVLFDVPNRAYLDPRGPVAAHVARHNAQGSSWKFATDDAAQLVTTRGLEADVVHVGHPRAHYGRLPWPATMVPVPGKATSFLVRGTRA